MKNFLKVFVQIYDFSDAFHIIYLLINKNEMMSVVWGIKLQDNVNNRKDFVLRVSANSKCFQLLLFINILSGYATIILNDHVLHHCH